MTNKTESLKASAVGINHVALEVGDIDEALAFYGRFLHFEIENKNDTQAFIYFGDQFINFTKHSDRKPDEKTVPGDTVTFEMYGISADYFKFITEAQTELFGSNPLFSGPPANISTNIDNGAVGFFAAVNVRRETAFADSKK